MEQDKRAEAIQKTESWNMKYNGVKKKGVLSLVYPFQLWSSCGMGWENSFGIIRVDYHRLKEENKKEEE